MRCNPHNEWGLTIERMSNEDSDLQHGINIRNATEVIRGTRAGDVTKAKRTLAAAGIDPVSGVRQPFWLGKSKVYPSSMSREQAAIVLKRLGAG
jgi:hypothetical protein